MADGHGDSPLEKVLEARRREYKTIVDPTVARKKRAEATVQVRRSKKMEQMAKRRRGGSAVSRAGERGGASAWGAGGTDPAAAFPSRSPEGVSFKARVERIDEYVSAIRSSSPEDQLFGVKEIRKLLSIDGDPPIEHVIRRGVVRDLVEMLATDGLSDDLLFEALWALTNIASGNSEHTRCVVNEGGVPLFLDFLDHEKAEIREQAVWALGNVAGDGAEHRDTVLSAGGLIRILGQLRPTDGSRVTTAMTRNVTWALSNLCRGKPIPLLSQVQSAIPALCYLSEYDDRDIQVDATWALSYLTDGPPKRVQAVVEVGVVPHLVSLLGHEDPVIKTPALRTIGNIVTGEDTQTDAVIDSGALPALLRLLDDPSRSIRKETCWTLSNITAGTAEQIEKVIEANLHQAVIDKLSVETIDVQREACWAVCNATACGTPEQIWEFFRAGAIPALVEILKTNDATMIGVSLEGILNLLRVGKHVADTERSENEVVRAIEEANGVVELERISRVRSLHLAKRAERILSLFFPVGDEGTADMGYDDDEDEDEDEDDEEEEEDTRESGGRRFGGGEGAGFSLPGGDGPARRFGTGFGRRD